MEFALPSVTVVPLIIEEARLKAVLLPHVGPDGSARLRLVKGVVDPELDPGLEHCARRHLEEQAPLSSAGLVECRIATGRDHIAEMREDVDGRLAEPA